MGRWMEERRCYKVAFRLSLRREWGGGSTKEMKGQPVLSAPCAPLAYAQVEKLLGALLLAIRSRWWYCCKNRVPRRSKVPQAALPTSWRAGAESGKGLLRQSERSTPSGTFSRELERGLQEGSSRKACVFLLPFSRTTPQVQRAPVLPRSPPRA